MDAGEVKKKLGDFIRGELIRRPDYPLKGDEGLISGGLIDSFSIAYIGVFIEEEFGVYIPDNDLTVDKMDTLDQMAARVMSR